MRRCWSKAVVQLSRGTQQCRPGPPVFQDLTARVGTIPAVQCLLVFADCRVMQKVLRKYTAFAGVLPTRQHCLTLVPLSKSPYSPMLDSPGRPRSSPRQERQYVRNMSLIALAA